MADDALEQFRGFFWPQALGLDPKANLKMREKIALAQMMQKRAMPKNLGEGLTAIGEALGERRLAIELEKQDRLSQEAGALLGATPAAASPVVTPTVRSSYAPTTDVETEEPTEQPPLATQVPPQQTPTPAPVVVRPPAPVPPPVQPPVVPPQALPPDQQQTYGPGDPVRMPARPYRPGGPQPGAGAPMAQPPPQAAAPPPPAGPAPLPPGDIPAPTFNDRMAPAGPAAGPRAEGGDPRAAIAMAWLQQQGTSPENPTTPAGGGPPGNVNGITDFSSQNRIPRAPAETPLSYIPPEMADPEGVPPTRPSQREMELRTLMRLHQGNPYAATSPAAVELQQLEAARARKDLEAQEIYKAKILRATKRDEQRQGAMIAQPKTEAEVLETRQKLIDYGRGRLSGAADDDALLGTERSPQRSGQPEADPVPRGVIPTEWAKIQSDKISKDAAMLESAKPELAEMLDLMNKVRAHPAKEASLGTLGGLAKLTPSGQDFAALNEQLKGKNLVAAYQKIKGTGPVGEREGENIAKAQAALATAGTVEGYHAALDTLETTVRGAVERAERKMRQPVTAYQKTPDDPYAPDLGQKGVRTINGRQVEVEYIGGDPAKDNSYRRRR